MQRMIIIILAVMVTLPVIIKSRVSGIKSSPAAFAVTSSSRIMVRVGGDVAQAGIYEVGANTLTKDVINMAVVSGVVKDLKPDEATALLVTKGTDLHLKIQPEGTGLVTVGSMPAGQKMVLGLPLEINSMSEADFIRLPGVGPVMAKRIIEYRHKNGGRMRVEDLTAVEGIGEKKYYRISKYF